MRLRRACRVHLMVGPPVDKEKDDYYVSRFMEGNCKKIVCGGTTSQVVSRYLKTSVRTSLDFPDKDVPPIGYIDGIDLTTEGVITLRKLLDLCDKYVSSNDLSPKTFNKKDGASLLAEMLLEEATHVTFFVGQGMNKAHQGLPIDITMKLKLVERLAANLEAAGKVVEIHYM